VKAQSESRRRGGRRREEIERKEEEEEIEERERRRRGRIYEERRVQKKRIPKADIDVVTSLTTTQPSLFPSFGSISLTLTLFSSKIG